MIPESVTAKLGMVTGRLNKVTGRLIAVRRSGAYHGKTSKNEGKRMSTTDFLLAQHGPLMSQEAVCRLIDRTPAGIRKSIHSGDEWTRPLIAAQKRIGRRVFYRTNLIGQFIDGDGAEK